MPYLPHTDSDRKEMLARIGLNSMDELFASIPAELRYEQELEVDAGLSEDQLLDKLKEIGSWNRPASERGCFLGAGIYNHGWPSVVDHIQGRSEFLTAYTPYQPECSQGTLQWIFEFQSMIAELCGLEVANASMYDGASACAEAALLALAQTRRKKLVVSAGVHPDARESLRTYLRHQEVELVEAPLVDGRTDWGELVDQDTAGILVQQPNFLGVIESLDEAVEKADAVKAMKLASIYPVAMGLLRSPGSVGFDVVVGEGQSFGVPMSYGGPHFGFFAARQKLVRRLPGRIVGTSVDREGRRAFTLTFQTREQHIRREKATSNICTNNSLMALRGCVHMAALGPQGLEELACLSRQRALELQHALAGVAGVEPAFPTAAFFNEIPFRVAGGDAAVAKLKQACAQRGLAAVIGMGKWYPELSGVFTLACTERTKPEHIRELADVFAAAINPQEVAV